VRGYSAEVLPTYFAYSGSGSVNAEVVYANYDHNEDYAYLASRGVDVAGKVALVRYGDIHCENMAGGDCAFVAAIAARGRADRGGRAGVGRRWRGRWELDSRRMRPAGAGFAAAAARGGRRGVRCGRRLRRIFSGACG
jgi:N-acetylated-alpha-linked acidic dipeptidase